MSIQRTTEGWIPRHVHIVRESHAICPQQPSVPTRFTESVGRLVNNNKVVREGKVLDPRPWNSLSFPERLETTPPPGREVSAARGRRQHQAKRNMRRFYRPQDQRDVQTVFVVIDRLSGQVLARVRGSAAHCEIEAEKLAQSQGGTIADLRVIFEGELNDA